MEEGRVVAQAVSRRIPTAAARVHVRAAYEVCGGQSGTGPGILRVFRFPLPIISPISPSSYSPLGSHNRPISGRSAELTQLDSTHHYTNVQTNGKGKEKGN
jgi:hypothetical protein